MKIKYIMFVMSGTLCAQTISNKDFEKQVIEFIASKAAVHHKPKTGFNEWLHEKMPWSSSGTIDCLVFNALDMHKNGGLPDTSFNRIYLENNFNIQAWSMPPSDKTDENISLVFGFPENYNASKPITITLYLLVQGEVSDASAAHIEIAVNSIMHGQKLGPHFLWYASTSNFSITESSNSKDLSLLIVEATIPPLIIQPKSLVTLQFNRIAPTDGVEEYDQDLYLESIVLAYERK